MNLKEITIKDEELKAFGLTMQDVIEEMEEAPEVYEKLCKNAYDILYTTDIRKSIKIGEEQSERGEGIPFEEIIKETKEWFKRKK